MRLSHYVVPIGEDNDPERLFALVQTCTESFYVLSEGAEEELTAALNGQLPSDHFLYVKGFVVADGTDEIAALRIAFRNSQSAPSNVALTIAPTMACNFGCDYCFESHRKGVMTESTQDAVVEAAKRLCLSAPPSARGIYVTWFGGEPLMGISAIERISESLLAWTGQHDPPIPYTAHIITNGSLLSSSMVDRLIACGVSSAQITLDGPQHVHDARRFFKISGQGSFATVVRNIGSAAGRLDVKIRINVDRRNVQELTELVERLNAEIGLPRVRVYLAQVERYSEEADATNVLSAEEFADVRRTTSRLCGQRGLTIGEPTVTPSFRGVCQVDRVNSFVIDANGELYRCWAELGSNSVSVGNVRDLCAPRLPVVPDGSLRARDPFDDPECLECKLLPMCMGSCPKRREVNRNTGRKECPPWKYEFEDHIRRRIIQLARARSEQARQTDSATQ